MDNFDHILNDTETDVEMGYGHSRGWEAVEVIDTRPRYEAHDPDGDATNHFVEIHVLEQNTNTGEYRLNIGIVECERPNVN